MYAELPPGTRLIFISQSGVSAWVQTVRIETALRDGTPKLYFMKAGTIAVDSHSLSGSKSIADSAFE